MIARQRIQAGLPHAGKTATVTCETSRFRVVIDGETVAIVPRATTKEVRRYKARIPHRRSAASPSNERE